MSKVTALNRGLRPAVAMLVTISLLATPAMGASPVGLDLSRIGDALHLEFNGAQDWKYEIKRDGNKGERVVLRLAGLKPEALVKIRSYSDALVKSVSVNENAIDGTTEIVFNVTNTADFFDYIADAPSRLILDFFPKEETKAADQPKVPTDIEKIDEEALTKKLAQKTKKLPAKKGELREPAGTDLLLMAKAELPPLPSLAEKISSEKDFSHGIFDGGDPEFKRFIVKDYEVKEDAIIASKANFYLPFPMLELGIPQLKTLLNVPPTYEIVANETRENKEARILLQLFSNKKKALFLKTADEFLKSYPESKYDEIIRYMVADTYFNEWREQGSTNDFEKAMGLYLSLAEKYPDSPITPRTLLLMGYSHVDRGDSFAALKVFQRFTRMFPNSKHLDRVNISIAEAYLKLNRFDDVLGMLEQIERTAKTTKARYEAAVRKGDVFFRKKDFGQAITFYKEALKKYPEAATQFPSAYYNIAESEFILGRYRDGLDSYRQFVQKFPDHEHGGYAMTRIGELLGILGAEPKRAQGAFLESNFRYRATPGAGVARIRLLTSRMPEMKDKEMGSALREIASITDRYANHPLDEKKDKEKAKKEGEATAAAAEGGHGKPAGGEHGKPADGKGGEAHAVAEENEKPHVEDPTKKPLELPGIEEFSTLLISDGFTARKEYDKAAKDLISYYQQNPQSPNKDKFLSRIEANTTYGIRAAVERSDFLEALRRYSKNSGSWLKHSGRIDVRYFVGKAYEQAGVYGEAANVYRDVLKRVSDLKGRQEREANVFEYIPKPETLNLRLAVVAAKDKDFLNAEARLKQIQTVKPLTDAEQIERAEVAAEVAEARGQADQARKYLTDLIKTWKGEPKLTSPLHLRIARLLTKESKFKEADEHLAKILQLKRDSGEVTDEVFAQALEQRGDLLVSRGKRRDAAKTYRELLEDFADKRPLDSVRYRLGQLLYEDGDMKGAEAAWSELKAESSNIWYKLAAEQMQGAKWQKEYKKYLERIPAAAEIR